MFFSHCHEKLGNSTVTNNSRNNTLGVPARERQRWYVTHVKSTSTFPFVSSPKPLHNHFFHTRRNLLRHAAASGFSLLLPACNRTEPPQKTSAANPVFAAGALRLDLRHRLTAGVETFTLERLRLEAKWPAGLTQFTNGPDWGDYRLSIYDPTSEVLMFRQGFDTGLATDARAATTQFSVRFPLPRRRVRATIEKRRGTSTFAPLSNIEIDPDAGDIDRSPIAMPTRVDVIHAGGEPSAKVDIAILGDGYRDAEYAKFVDDAKRAAGYWFSVEPFKARQGDFNVSAVFAASADSGITDPYLGLKKNTVLGCAYYSGGSERSLADGNRYALREVASAIAYDFVLVLANARRYGGSAYFGGPAAVAIDSAAAPYLVIHEFAHAIGGLADEYYVPAAGGPSYGGNVEPWYPNVTLSPANGKWRERLSEPASQPGAWNKAEYDLYFANYVKRYEALRARGVEEKVVEQFMEQERQRQAALLAKNGPPRKVGYYEGANGYAKGMFRAEVDCIMFSLQTQHFCAACSTAIERMIDVHYRG